MPASFLNKLPPSDPYSPLWGEFNRQYPARLRSVGAAAQSDVDGGTRTKVDLTSAEAKAAMAAAVEEATSGLKSNRDAVLSEKKVLADALRKFDGLDADRMREVMANIGKSEETKLIADGKLEEVWDLRSAAMQSHFDAELAARDTKITELAANEGALKTRLADLNIGTVIRDAATKQKLLPTAVGDALIQGRSLFSMQDDGSLAIVDKHGFVQPGPDGKTALQPDEWLQSIKETKPHWWAQSNGGGVTGGAGHSTNGATLDRNRFDSLSQSERSKFIDGGGSIA